MSRRAPAAVLAAMSVVLLAAAAAAASVKTTKVATAVEIEQLTTVGPYAAVGGVVTADDARCVGGRDVAIAVIGNSGERIAFDVARTGDEGGWFGIHDQAVLEDHAPLQAVKVKVRKRKVAISKSRALVCQAKRTSIGVL